MAKLISVDNKVFNPDQIEYVESNNPNECAAFFTSGRAIIFNLGPEQFAKAVNLALDLEV